MTLPANKSERAGEFISLFTQNSRQVYGYIRALVHHQSDAEDVFQEASRVMWQKFDQYQSDSDFLAWACCISHYEVLMYRRRVSRRLYLFRQRSRERLQYGDVRRECASYQLRHRSSHTFCIGKSGRWPGSGDSIISCRRSSPLAGLSSLFCFMRLLAILLITLTVSGCQKGSPHLVAVTGFVRVDGLPLKDGVIVFEAEDGATAKGKIVNGEILEVTTHTPNDGAATGHKLVAVRPAEATSTAGKGGTAQLRDSNIPERYKDPTTSNLTCDIVNGPNKLIFTLVSDPKIPAATKHP